MASAFQQTMIQIPSAVPGWNLDTWRYIPTAKSTPYTVILMAHGLGANKTMGLREYAEFFAELGYAAVVFDYRHWGSSDGTPRSILNIPEQLEDYRTVIKYSRQQSEFDPNRIVLWGTSFSGGHVTTLAAERELNIYATIAQCPYLGSTAPLAFGITFVKTFVHGLVDAVMQATGYGPHYIPNCGPAGEVAVMNTPESWEGFKTIAWGVPGADTPNEINASSIFTLRSYRPCATAQDIDGVFLLITMMKDSLCTQEALDECERKIRNLTLVKLDGGHFEPYPNGPHHEASLNAMKEFLEKHVPL